MPRYSDDLINEIIAENDIVDYISQYVRLKQSGRDFSGLCPFHKEKSPSFHVNRDKQVYHCFGCGAGGGLMQFVMQIEGLDFVESLKLLADRAGIILPEDGDVKVDDKKHRMKMKILEINKESARFFYNTLTKTDEGKVGLEYFKQRKISPQTIIKYGLGYSPDQYDALLGYLRKKGYSDNELVESGVVAVSNGKIYDRFRGRVIFPIIDLRGNIIGFGARTLKEGYLPNGKKIMKYLNTSDTLAFDKGRNLFSLNFAKENNTDKMILCEGYMDVISLYQSGVTNAVATLGTAITENQAKLLMKYTKEIVICYDTDEPGQKATRRAIDIINSVGGKAKVMHVVDAKDPDEYIKNNGPEAFRLLVDSAVPSSEYLIKNVRRKYNLDTEEGKIKYASESAEALSGVTNPIEVDAYIKKISAESGISSDVIYAEYKKKAAISKTQNKTSLKTPQINIVTVNKSKKNSVLQEAQIRLLGLLANSKKMFKLASEKFCVEDYSDDILQNIAKIIYECWENDVKPDTALILNKCEDSESSAIVAKIFCIDNQYGSDENAVAELITKIKQEKIKQKLEGETNPAIIAQLIKERDKIGRNE